MNGTAVVNNPFWWARTKSFFNNCIAEKVGVAVPKLFLPSNQRPPETETDASEI
ncbi:MAG: hypothetical protein M1G31_06490 [Pseudanabaena sp. Salubria-1]|nr:hypothetical protein [Pseudanabaena sp. Salubria-1]